MQIKLNEDGLLARYYKWLTNRRLPRSLCPYFWQMVFFVVISPIIFTGYGVFKAFEYLIGKIPEGKELTWEQELKSEKMWDRIAKVFEIIGKVFIAIMIIAPLTLFVLVLIQEIKEHGWVYVLREIFTVVGIALTSLGVILGVAWLILEHEVFQKIGRSMVIQVPVQLISGMYHKMCPLIVWESDKLPEAEVSEDILQEAV